VTRLRGWDFSTPTGIPEGYDAADVNGALSAPSSAEIEASIAATIYSVWRGQFIKNTIDAVLGAGNLPRPSSALTVTALKNLLDNFATRNGAGASGVQFFNVPGVANTAATAPTRRDILILASMADTLGLLASEPFERWLPVRCGVQCQQQVQAFAGQPELFIGQAQGTPGLGQLP
jgi:penicillin amidase